MAPYDEKTVHELALSTLAGHRQHDGPRHQEPDEVERGGFPWFVRVPEERELLEERFPEELKAWRKAKAERDRMAKHEDRDHALKKLEEAFRELKRCYEELEAPQERSLRRRRR